MRLRRNKNLKPSDDPLWLHATEADSYDQQSGERDLCTRLRSLIASAFDWIVNAILSVALRARRFFDNIVRPKREAANVCERPFPSNKWKRYLLRTTIVPT